MHRSQQVDNTLPKVDRLPHNSHVFEAHRFRAKRGQLKRFSELSPESKGQHLALTVLYVPNSLDSGTIPSKA